jgi:hypothetical protein
MIKSPLLAKPNRAGQYLRLCLAEAATYGVPGPVIVLMDDIGAMLGLFEPLPTPAAHHLGAPMVAWQTSTHQPTFERVDDVERQAYKERALIAYGGGPPGMMCGPAEVVVAMGNTVQGLSPPEFYELFQWASLKTLETLFGTKPEEALKDPSKEGWKLIPDAEVLEPGGRLYQTYMTVSTTIRREAIARMTTHPDSPRAMLKPFAKLFLENNARVREEAELSGEDDRVIEMLAESDRVILEMFPELAEIVDAAPPIQAVEQDEA